jgi:predicted TIM-barrel fold metal-dependent hydrolase
MDFSGLGDFSVIDGHIHFPHPTLMDDVLAAMERPRVTRANLVAVPDLERINQNPALIHFKAHHPQRVTICGALDYTDVFAAPDKASETLETQIRKLQAIGFDGLKLIEGKPMVRQMLPLRLDGPAYAGMWRALEETEMPVVCHVADPEEFWDVERCPDWARDQGWFYGESAYPSKEVLYEEVDRVLEHHAGLSIVFAHFYFLSNDLARAGDFLDAHPRVCFDLTPGVEMYLNFARDPARARDFFIRYQDRLIYGTDIGAGAIGEIVPAGGLDMTDSAGRAWVVRSFLESDEAFSAPEGMGHWLGMDAEGFHGIALPPEVLEKVYRANFERLFGAAPTPLEHQVALAELERMAAAIDAQAGRKVDSEARQVARELEAFVQ